MNPPGRSSHPFLVTFTIAASASLVFALIHYSVPHFHGIILSSILNLTELPKIEQSNLYEIPFPRLEADEKKKEAVVTAFKDAWNAYKSKAWGSDFFRPISQTGDDVIHSGITIVDSLDTMILMGLNDEVELSKKWISENFTINGRYSIFEITIRIVGGFLSAYQLSGDRLFLTKALKTAESMLPAFSTNSGLFRTYGTFSTNGESIKMSPEGSRETLLSDIGAIQLEFYTLSLLTGDDRFSKAASRIHCYLFRKYPNEGLFPERISTSDGSAASSTYGIDSMSDSFYECLIKIWIMTNDSQPHMLQRYLLSMKDIEEKLLVSSSSTNWTYVGSLRGGHLDHTMTHLAAFAPGMMAVGAVKKNPKALKHLEIADKFVSTLFKLYRSQSSGLMPECVKLNPRNENFGVCDSKYQLRPETVESLFVMYRFTGLQKYRDYAWQIFQSIAKSCKVKSGGFASLTNTNGAELIDFMDSYFLAETLKYLFLIFSDSETLPQSQFVFNTEAHPLKIWSRAEVEKMMNTFTNQC